MIEKRCKHCGSTNIRIDAWAEWDVTSQNWLLVDVYDNSWCIDCEGETTPLDVEV